MHIIEKRMKIQNQFSSWPQSFPSYFNSLLKNGLPPVLKAGSSGIYKDKGLEFKKLKKFLIYLIPFIETLFLR